MLYSLLYGNKTKTTTRSANSKLFKMAIQTERVKNDVPDRRVPHANQNLPFPVEFSNGDDLILCEATKMVEDMICNVTVHPRSIKTYPRKKIKILKKFENNSKIFQNIIELSNIYSQHSNSSFENVTESIELCINCPEVDPDAQKFEIKFECGFGLDDGEEEDIFSLYDHLDIKEEPISEDELPPSELIPSVSDINLQEYTALDENLPNWYDIYRRIDSELITENLNNDHFLNSSNFINKKFKVKIGNSFKLLCISVTDAPNNGEYQHQNDQFVEQKLFNEVDDTVSSSKRRFESEDEHQSTPKKLLKVCQPSSTYEKCLNIPDLLDEDDTFISAIKLELAVGSPEAPPVSVKTEYIDDISKDHVPDVEPYFNNTNKFEAFNAKCFDGFQTGHGKPIDLPKNHIFQKYMQLYQDMDIKNDDLLAP